MTEHCEQPDQIEAEIDEWVSCVETLAGQEPAGPHRSVGEHIDYCMTPEAVLQAAKRQLTK